MESILIMTIILFYVGLFFYFKLSDELFDLKWEIKRLENKINYLKGKIEI